MLVRRQRQSFVVEGQGQVPIFGLADEAVAVKLRGSNDDALYLKYQDLLSREVFTSFGLTPQGAGIERDVNRNTAEVGEDRDWDFVIRPTARLLAQYLTRKQISERLGFSQIEHRFIGLDREDEEATSKILDRLYRANSLTPNEIREKFGEEPSDNPFSDMLFIDTQIAMQAARGAGVVDDENLQEASEKSSTAPNRGKKGAN